MTRLSAEQVERYNATRRERYRTDPGYRAARLAASKDGSAKNAVRRRANAASWYAANRDSQLILKRKYNAEHQESEALRSKIRYEVHREEMMAAAKIQRSTAPARKRNADLKRVKAYGTDGADLLSAQGGLCAVCGVDLSILKPRQRHVDHDHDTGLVRGWLCHHCNTCLGLAKDDPAILRAAAKYLEQFEVFK